MDNHIKKQDQALLPAYKQIYAVEVKWGDMDAMRHVNNTRYFYYCESARLDFLLKLFPDIGKLDPSQLESGIALAYSDCKFKVPVTFPDTMLVGTAITEIADNEFWIKHAIYSKKMSVIAAESRARLVYYDFKQSQRKLLSDQMRQQLEQFKLEN